MNSPLKVKKTKKGASLRRWFKEEWKTPKGKEDYTDGENTFRPTKRVSKDTPATWNELTPAEKARGQIDIKRNKMTIDDAKLYALNTTTLGATTFMHFEDTLKIILLLVTIGYTISKWIGVKKNKK